MKKDYSLLRPFDEAAAKRGEMICYKSTPGTNIKTFLAGPDAYGYIAYVGSNDKLYTGRVADFCMAPLAWVEGKPVYPGDTLYWRPEGRKFVARAVEHDCGNEWVIGTDDCNYLTENITWTPQMMKREGWVNIYPPTDSSVAGNTSHAYRKKEAADCNARESRIACVRIEWEEPATQEGGE